MSAANQLSFARRAQGVLSRIVPDRRRHKRVAVTLLGRFMRENKQEYPCRLIDISVGGAAVLSQVQVDIDERVVAYFDHVGGIEGNVVREFDGGFAFRINATRHKQEKLAAQLTWLANRDILNLPEDRRHDRIVPRNPIAVLTMEDGQRMSCRIIDLSLSGAAVAAETRPPLKSVVRIGCVPARVVRFLEEGFALEFTHPQDPETLEESVSMR